MSPQDSVRRRLLDEAARVLADEGPAALSARRLVRAVGASTMAVYTHFGSMPALVREVIREGFERFMARTDLVRPTDDPVADLYAVCRVYQEFARAEPNVYAVMFGGSQLAGFELADEDREMGTFMLRVPHGVIRRCTAVGRFRDGDASLRAWQLWCQMHGLAQLERAGYFTGPRTPDETLLALVRDFAIGQGDRVEAASASAAASTSPAAPAATSAAPASAPVTNLP
ncbi:TetR/AcrR family transcriptional regulator [Streptomyces sp. NBC_01210]|uniref:TetR/AcrR family transcriptional regulator n=1 Tax=Streptomyces sp. NBC_01210 TaxID=2903774 RepID=UPI002E15B708|nr:TetR/AcrR family transcriptional regulator [Streptomyces sp. NBC_01210]